MFFVGWLGDSVLCCFARCHLFVSISPKTFSFSLMAPFCSCCGPVIGGHVREMAWREQRQPALALPRLRIRQPLADQPPEPRGAEAPGPEVRLPRLSQGVPVAACAAHPRASHSWGGAAGLSRLRSWLYYQARATSSRADWTLARAYLRGWLYFQARASPSRANWALARAWERRRYE